MTLQEVIRSLPKQKNMNSSMWVRIFARPISHLLTYVFLKLNVSANLVTIASSIICILMALSTFFENSLVLFNIAMHLWLILDCVDGNLARISRLNTKPTLLKSNKGEFLDAMYGYLYVVFLFPSLGFLYASKSNYFLDYIFILSFLIPILHLFNSVISNKYDALVSAVRSEYSDSKNKGMFFYFYRIDKNIGISGFMLPFITIATIYDLYNLLVPLYFLYYLLMSIILMLIYTRNTIND